MSNGWYVRILSGDGNPEYAFEETCGDGPFATREDAIREAAHPALAFQDRIVVGYCTVVREAPACPFDASDAINGDIFDGWSEHATEEWCDLASSGPGGINTPVDDLQARLETLWSEWIERHGLRVEVCRFDRIEEVKL